MVVGGQKQRVAGALMQQPVNVEVFFKELDSMVKEHVPGAYKAFKNHGKIDFGQKPDDYDNSNRHYKIWHQTKGGNYYQGETDKDGKPDGRGIFIRPEDQVVFVHFKKSVLHGRALVFFSTGQKEIGSFKDNKKHGEVIVTF